MPEIGATLREARMRARIDITDIESATKIRAKYLRALENEEWDLLPGPTYVKTFLRTYAEALGLDAKLLVEEYRLRHESRGEAHDYPTLSTNLARERRARQRTQRTPRIGRGGTVAVLVVALVGALFVLGSLGEDDEPATPAPVREDASQRAPVVPEDEPGRTRAKRPATQTVSLALRPSAAVWVCLEDAGGRRLIPGREITTPTRTFRSRRFRLTLGNGLVELRVGRRLMAVPDSSDAIGYEITARGRRTLSEARRPVCA